MKKHRLSIIIPAYNEKKTIGIILKKVYEHKLPNIQKEIIIVESNSSDGTKEVVKKFVKRRKGVKLILEERPQGKGHALRQGFAQATGDIILIQDADLEYNINDYMKLITPIIENKTSFVLGSRHMDHSRNYIWSIRKFNNKIYAVFMNIGGLLFHAFFNLVFGTRLTDPTTMYKVFRRKLLKNIHLKGQYFELDFELVGKLIRTGNIPLEVPIQYHSRGLEEGKKVRILRDAPRYVKTILITGFSPKRYL